MLSETQTLKKAVWTEADFEDMVWVDTIVRALAFFPDSYEFALDIDHTIRWIAPQTGAVYYDRWTAPATLVFQNVHELSINADFVLSCALDDVERQEPRVPPNADYISNTIEWNWVLNFVAGEISFRSTGFSEYFRRQPVLKNRLSLEERGGISFERALAK